MLAKQTEYTLPASFTPDKQQRFFEEIVRLYDMADEIMEAVSRDGITNRDVQIELARPFVTQIVNSTNILATFYTEVVRNKCPITPELQDTVETAFRNIFYSFKDFLDTAEEKLSPKDETKIVVFGGDMNKKRTPAPEGLSLEQRYLHEHKNGTLQNRGQALESGVDEHTGRPLVQAARKPGRHIIEYLKDLVREELPLISDAQKAAPIFGKASEAGRKDTVISPALASVVKLS